MGSSVGGGSAGRIKTQTWMMDAELLMYIANNAEQQKDLKQMIRTEDVHLHTPALRIGTHFLLTLETVVFLFHLLSTT